MRRVYLWFSIAILALVVSRNASAGEYQLINGDKLRGEPASFDDTGLVVRLDVGGFSSRVSWSKLTQDSLKELAKDPRAAKFVEPFIDIPIEQQVKKKKREIKVQPVQSRLERPPRSGIVAALGSPIGLTVLALLFLANLYAAYEVAVFRNRPAVLVCGVSAVFPFIGPLLFLSFPTEGEYEEAPAMEGVEMETPAAVAAQGKKTTGRAAPASGLGLAAAEKEAAGPAEPMVFKRGETTFNRRFFETKFSGFFRVVPSEAEKDMVVVIRAAKNEYVAKRISRISSSDLHVQLLNGATEAMVPFGDIAEVRVRHKDAK